MKMYKRNANSFHIGQQTQLNVYEMLQLIPFAFEMRQGRYI